MKMRGIAMGLAAGIFAVVCCVRRADDSSGYHAGARDNVWRPIRPWAREWTASRRKRLIQGWPSRISR